MWTTNVLCEINDPTIWHQLACQYIITYLFYVNLHTPKYLSNKFLCRSLIWAERFSSNSAQVLHKRCLDNLPSFFRILFCETELVGLKKYITHFKNWLRFLLDEMHETRRQWQWKFSHGYRINRQRMYKSFQNC